jgi:hypothetical protein
MRVWFARNEVAANLKLQLHASGQVAERNDRQNGEGGWHASS